MTSKNWTTIPATEIRTGDITEVGRVCSVDNQFVTDLGWLSIEHDEGRPLMRQPHEMVEVYR